MKLLRYSIFCSLLFLTACGGDVTFRPEPGDSRQYQLHSRVELDLRAGGRRQSTSQQVSLLASYQVESVRPHLLLLRADYLRMRSPAGSFSSSDDAQSPEWRELLAEGFELEFDQDSGALLDFRGRHREHWQALLKNGGERFASDMRRQLSAPALQRIPARVGAEVRLQNFQGSEELLLRVKAVDEESLLASLEQQGEETRAYGYLRLERKTGWLQRLALISEQPVEEYGVRGSSRTQLLILPAGEDVGMASLDAYAWGEPDAEGFVFPAWEEQAGELPNGQAGVADVFPSRVGQLDHDEDKIRLEYQHALTSAEGTLVYDDIRALDANGNLLDLRLLGAAGAMSPGWQSGEPLNTSASYLPLGWRNTRQKLAALHEIRVRADYYPFRHERIELPVDAGGVSRIEVDGAWVELTPTETSGEYILGLGASARAHFSLAIEGLAGAHGWLHAEPPPASWLGADDLRLLRAGIGDGAAWHYRVKFAGLVPRVLGVHLLTRETRTPFSQELQFLSAQAAYDRLDIPPPVTYYLHADPAEQLEPSAALFDLQTLRLEDVELNRLRLTLTAEQSALCELKVLDAPSEAGHALVWMPAPAEYGNSGDMQLPRSQQWQLRTHDGVRQYFYGVALRSQLSCSGRAVWRQVDLALGERPWLIDPRRLPGYVEKADMHAATFLRRYRFLDQSGRALALLPATFQQQGLDIGIAPLREFLTEDGLLRVAGTPVRVEQLHSEGEPLQKSWSTTLAPLP